MGELQVISVPGSGIRLSALSAGPPGAPLVVLLHGFPEYAASWRSQLTFLSDLGLHAVAPDLRGYNQSDKPPRVSDYDLAHLTADVLAILDHFGAAQAYIIGHDWGGAVAWDFAMRYPDRVRKLVILNCPHPTRMSQGLRTWRQLKKSWYIFFFQLPALPEWYLRRRDYLMIRKAFGRKVGDADRQGYVDAARIGGLRGAIHYYRQAARNVLFKGKIGALAAIAAPVHVIWGEADLFLGRELATPSPEWVPNLTMHWVPGAGHWVQQEAPQAVNAILGEVVVP